MRFEEALKFVMESTQGGKLGRNHEDCLNLCQVRGLMFYENVLS